MAYVLYLGGMAIMNGFKSKEANRAVKEEAESEGRETSETSDEQSSNLSDEPVSYTHLTLPTNREV